MRMLSVILVLSPFALAGGIAPAMAQDAMAANPAVVVQPASRQGQVSGAAQLPAGAVAKPTTESPGLVVGIKLGELYTDNVKLAGKGEPKDGRFITVAQPFMQAAYKSKRLTGVLDASLTGYLYAGHSGENQLAQHLNTNGTLTVVPQHLFLDGAASYGREIINNQRPAGGGTFFLGGNRANVATAALSPYWMQELGGFGTMTLRYTEGRIIYNTNGIKGSNRNELSGISDVTTYGLNFSIISPKDRIWGWKLLYSGERVKPDNRESLRFAQAKAELSRRFGLHSRVLVDYGKENRYFPNGEVDTLGSKFWSVGYRWTDPRNDFLLDGGHHFYGRSARLSWTHNASRLTTHVGYKEQPTDLNQQLMGRAAGINLDVPRGVSGIPSLFDRRVYLMKRASASAEYLMPKGNLKLTLYNEKRDFFFSHAGHETVSDAHLAWRFELGPFTTITPTVGWQRYRLTTQQVNYTNYEQIVFVHKIHDGDFISARLRHASRNVNAIVPGNYGYAVNVIYFSWTHLFGQH